MSMSSQKNRRLGQLGKKEVNKALKRRIHSHNARVSVGSTAVPAAVQATVEKALINEKKKNAHFVDLALANYALDTTGSITLVPTIAQGASQSQRLGKKVLLKSVQIRGHATANSATTVADGAALLVYDRDPTNTLPNITDILNTVHSASFNNDTNSDRFKIVRRWDFPFCGNTTTPSTGKEIHSFDEYVDLRNLPMQFGNVGTGAMGDIKLGALYFVTCGTQAVGTTAANINCGFRTRFISQD